MDKPDAEALLTQAEFFLYYPQPYPGKKVDVFGLYFREPEKGRKAFNIILSQLNEEVAKIEFVVATQNRLNIIIKHQSEEIITQALDIYANDTIISNLFTNQHRANLRSTALLIFAAYGEDGRPLPQHQSADGEPPLLISVRGFSVINSSSPSSL